MESHESIFDHELMKASFGLSAETRTIARISYRQVGLFFLSVVGFADACLQ